MPVPVDSGGGDDDVGWSQEIRDQLKEIKEDLANEELTVKGYWNKKIKILKPVLTEDAKAKVSNLTKTMKAGDMKNEEFYEKLQVLLVPDTDTGEAEKENLPNRENHLSNSTSSGGAGAASSQGSSSSSAQSSSSPMSRRSKLKDEDKSSRSSSRQQQQTISSMFAKAPVKRKAGEEDSKPAAKRMKEVKVERCKICNQNLLGQLTFYGSHPNGAADEYTALFDERIQIETNDAMDGESKPQFKITGFTIYDKESHVTRFDTNLIEKNRKIYMSGYLKAIYDEDTGIEGGVPVKDVGDIVSWWTSGFDGGDAVILGVSSEIADYILMQPSELYRPFMNIVHEKSFLIKHVIEFLEKAISPENNVGDQYEDLVNYLELIVPPEGMDPLNNEMLIKHAEFIVGQIFDYEGCENDDYVLVTLPAVKDLIRICGFDHRNRKKESKRFTRSRKEKLMPKHTDATVTPVIRQTFEMVFRDQMRQEEESGKKSSKSRMKRCGLCENCLKSDCGVCRNCKDMTKFGGSGRSKQACKERKCENRSLDGPDLEDSDEELEVEEITATKDTTTPVKTKSKLKKNHKEVEWQGEGRKVGKRTYYNSALMDGEISVSVGDTVLIQPEQDNIPLYIAKIISIFDGCDGAMTHVQWFGRNIDTVLGEEAGDKTEVFLLTECEDQPLLSIWRHCQVTHQPRPDFQPWRGEGGQEPKETMVDDGCNFWWRYHYTPGTARFEYQAPFQEKSQDDDDPQFCGVCARKKELKSRFQPQVLDKCTDSFNIISVKWNNTILKVGDCIYLSPGSVTRKIKQKKRVVESHKSADVDAQKYPEYYRKNEYIKGNNNDTPDPFQVAIIKRMFKDCDVVKLKVRIFYRPEDTHKGAQAADSEFFNMLYWTDEEGTVSFDDVQGRCFVKYQDINVSNQELEVWSEEGPDRWWFRQWYNSQDQRFEYDFPDDTVMKIGHTAGKGGKGGKGKGKSSAAKTDDEAGVVKEKQVAEFCFPAVPDRLRCLDIFSGCGGLSHGLHEAGVADSRWAVEIFEPAAKAYKLNNPGCEVFSDDCNLLLAQAIGGETENAKKQKIPAQGEVDLLCGGPPCQGFSGMNRFNHREYSQFKNSLVSTYLSYCDYYRPKYFILENVKNFASFKKSMVLKLCITALLKMGYQCTFAVLQAGQFGVAQTRRRAIILAAAPGETLPLFPEPRHVFSPKACSLRVQIDNVIYTSNARWTDSAPYRTCTVRDMMSDLPHIKSGDQNSEISYGGEPQSHFQRRIRNGSKKLLDHVTKKQSPLIDARMELIPKAPGSDWRDLPNIVMTLSDGSMTKKLDYFFHDHEKGMAKDGSKRGVCSCAESRSSKCNPLDKQDKTLIPWCLPHTSNRHNNWAGLYGRNDWDGFFSTTITNPEPMGKQGRVLHPDQDRLVSVRECARSQGFPDTYKFYGTIIEKYRQIGNAVPPPMGKALGLQIREAMYNARLQNNTS